MTVPAKPEPAALFKSDNGTIAYEALKDGSKRLRVRHSSWDDAKVIEPGERLELVWQEGQAWARKKGKPR